MTIFVPGFDCDSSICSRGGRPPHQPEAENRRRRVQSAASAADLSAGASAADAAQLGGHNIRVGVVGFLDGSQPSPECFSLLVFSGSFSLNLLKVKLLAGDLRAARVCVAMFPFVVCLCLCLVFCFLVLF